MGTKESNVIKVYQYDKCGTCQKAFRFLDRHKVAYQKVAIRDNPPTAEELKKMLEDVGGNIRRLFNTSGQDYRSLKIGERLDSMPNEEAIALLASHGNLVKRPFVVTGKRGLVGFNEEEWKKYWLLLNNQN